MARLGRGYPFRPTVIRLRRIDDAVELGTFATTWSFPTFVPTTPDISVTLDTFATAWEFPAVGISYDETASLSAFATVWEFPALDVDVPILPGQLITGDFQIEWAGQRYGGYGNVYQIIAGSVEGWDDLPGLDSDSALRPSRHGAWPGKSLAQQREVSAIIAVDDPVTFIASLRALRRATAVAEGDSERTLVINTYGEALLANAMISARAIPTEHYRQGWAEVSLRWTCSDPRRFDLSQQSTVIAEGDSETLTNDGDSATSPRFRILGPAVNPVLTNETSNRILGFDITLTGGQLLEIDTQLGKVFIGDVSHMTTLSSPSVPVEDFVLAVGDNVVTFETDSGGTTGVEAIWRAAYL